MSLRWTRFRAMTIKVSEPGSAETDREPEADILRVAELRKSFRVPRRGRSGCDSVQQAAWWPSMTCPSRSGVERSWGSWASREAGSRPLPDACLAWKCRIRERSTSGTGCLIRLTNRVSIGSDRVFRSCSKTRTQP